MSQLNCINELLNSGLDDWIQAAEVASVARTGGGRTSEAEVRDLSIMLIGELLEQGLMEVGTVTEGGFTAWGLSVEQALRHIEREWRALPEGPDLGDICWLNLTEKGSVRAAEILALPEGGEAEK